MPRDGMALMCLGWVPRHPDCKTQARGWSANIYLSSLTSSPQRMEVFSSPDLCTNRIHSELKFNHDAPCPTLSDSKPNIRAEAQAI